MMDDSLVYVYFSQVTKSIFYGLAKNDEEFIRLIHMADTEIDLLVHVARWRQFFEISFGIVVIVCSRELFSLLCIYNTLFCPRMPLM